MERITLRSLDVEQDLKMSASVVEPATSSEDIEIGAFRLDDSEVMLKISMIPALIPWIRNHKYLQVDFRGGTYTVTGRQESITSAILVCKES